MELETTKIFLTIICQQQINNIKRKDSSLYRISQTKTRLQADDETLTANYNEGLAYGFYSIAGYTSSPSSSQLIALNKFGYRTEQQRMSIVNTSILPVDSILGVKYILKSRRTSGYAGLLMHAIILYIG